MGREFKVIARVHTDFPQKFGIPRQSGLIKELEGTVVFEKEYRNADALRGIEGFSHIWLLWEFSESVREEWQPTVRPPRLGGNKKMGVFATRSPFRPNPIGLSLVKLESIEKTENEGTVLHILGADLLDGTPIYDIKPYLPFADCVNGATGGFAEPLLDYELEVVFPESLLCKLPPEKRKSAVAVLKGDPRPSYKADSDELYGLCFAGFNIKFSVKEKVLTVKEVEQI